MFYRPSMRRRSRVALLLPIALLWLLVGTRNSVSQPLAEAPETDSELVRVSDDVYAFRDHRHVAIFITTDEGVIVIDPIGLENPDAPQLLKDAIASVTSQPVRYVVYSHWGEDHAKGG